LNYFINLLNIKCSSLKTEAEDAILNKKRSTKAEVKYKKRQRFAKVEPAIDEQFQTSRLLGKYHQLILMLKTKKSNAMMIFKLLIVILNYLVLIVLINYQSII